MYLMSIETFNREGTQDQYLAGPNFSNVTQPNKHVYIHFYNFKPKNPPSLAKKLIYTLFISNFAYNVGITINIHYDFL